MDERGDDQKAVEAAGRAAGRAREAWRFLVLAVAKARQDELGLQSAALAFITVLSLVPLLAAVSYFGAQAFSGQQARLVDLLAEILPYSEDAILEQVSGFLAQARTIRGFGVVIFLFTALRAFSEVETTINRVWHVARRRPFHVRLRSFTLVLFWGPLLIGATYSSLFFLGQQAPIKALAGNLAVALVPFAMTVIGLTVLYWLVPYTVVHFRSALIGGLVAALLLEAVRQVFGLSLGIFQRVSLIYGSFGLALVFMISIQVAWWLVLLGSEVAYCVQHAELMRQPRRSAADLDGAWLGLVAMAVIADRFLRGTPITPRERLAEQLSLADGELPQVLEPLLAKGLLAPSSDGEGYLLSCDPYRLPARDVLACYEVPNRQLLAPLPDALGERLGSLRETLVAAREQGLGSRTLARLVRPADPAGG